MRARTSIRMIIPTSSGMPCARRPSLRRRAPASLQSVPHRSLLVSPQGAFSTTRATPTASSSASFATTTRGCRASPSSRCATSRRSRSSATTTATPTCPARPCPASAAPRAARSFSTDPAVHRQRDDGHSSQFSHIAPPLFSDACAAMLNSSLKMQKLSAAGQDMRYRLKYYAELNPKTSNRMSARQLSAFCRFGRNHHGMKDRA
eukprot:6198590-Pleurochrysis_carterae.AAC.3